MESEKTKQLPPSGPSGFYTAMAGEKAETLYKDTSIHINRYIKYLNQAIETRRKRRIKCRWEEIGTGLLTLKPQKLFRITPVTKFRLTDVEDGWLKLKPQDDRDDFSPETDGEYVEWGKGKGMKQSPITWKNGNNGTYLIKSTSIEIPAGITVRWQGYDFICDELLPHPIKNVTVNGTPAEAEEINSREYRINKDISSGDQLQINGEPFGFEISARFDSEKFKNEYPGTVDEGGELLYSANKKPEWKYCEITDITDKIINSDSFLSNLEDEDGNFNPGDWQMGRNGNEIFLKPTGSKKALNKMTFHHKKYPSWKIETGYSDRNEKWIQLIEDSDRDEGGRSELDFFFEENVEIYPTEDRRGTPYKIVKQNSDEYRLRIRKPDEKRDCYPENEYLYLKPNLNELINQRDALRNLEQKPFKENLPLLELMEKRSSKEWDSFERRDTSSIEWEVLTDETFDGCDKQREFVAVALETPDFAILNGPPGTGKTTTILELIYQLIREGKRVLLAASTNAAINNILERIKPGDGVYATRIGREDKADGVEEYLLDRQAEEWKEQFKLDETSAERLVLESSNLVCGTTTGIHRIFSLKNQNQKESMSDLLTKGGAPFDVMIIDECSKTTFQEFIVSARLAKRWILVGDIRQLSPFTDRTEIVANLENINGMDPALRNACYHLFMAVNRKNDRLIIPVPRAEIDRLLKESESDRFKDLEENIFIVGDEEIIINDPSVLYEKNILFIERECYNKYKAWMPQDAFLVDIDNKKGWPSSHHAFAHYADMYWKDRYYRYRGDECTDADRVNHVLMEVVGKEWADEVCWRMEQIYWMRLLGETKKSLDYRDEIYLLTPETIDAKYSMDAINSIAFPSVLESLSTDGQYLGSKIEDTLSRGFTEKERECRSVTLTYQHRMHPDISKAPRDLFYTERGKAESLKDGRHLRTDRGWDYMRYPAHAVWRNCNGTVTKGTRNANEKEADLICSEVKQFCDWCERVNWYNKDGKRKIAVLTFYKGQESLLREKLQKLTNTYGHRQFSYKGCSIKLSTVDYFQGQEADIVFLSMVNTSRDGFLNSPNRMNVGVTRARYQMVIVGKHDYFKKYANSEFLRELAGKYEVMNLNSDEVKQHD